MGFKFGLQAVLKHRTRMEEVAQREFFEAQRAVDEILKRIEEMYRRMDEVREEIHAAQVEGSARKLEEVRSMEEFLINHRRRIDQTRLEARELMEVAEEKQEALIIAAREKKILVKLRERRLQEYRDWLNRMEAKELDDLTMVRQGWEKR